VFDAIILKVHVQEGDFKTASDYRSCIDERLSQAADFPGLLKFKDGWFMDDTTDAASAAETTALLSQLVLCIVEDDWLVPDLEMRKRLLAVTIALVNLARECRTPQEYTDFDLTQLQTRLDFILKGFSWLMDFLGPHCPGDGFAIPKVHDMFSGLVKQILHLGSPMNSCTGKMEQLQKFVKKIDESVCRRKYNNGAETVFTRSICTEANISEISRAPHVEPCSVPFRPHVAHATIQVGKGSLWAIALRSLSVGMNGPAINSTTLDEMEVFLLEKSKCSFPGLVQRNEVTSPNVPCFFSHDAVIHELNLKTMKEEVKLLRGGHCIELKDGRYAQILLTNIHFGGSFLLPRLKCVLLISVFEMVHPLVNDGRHPEVPFIWLHRPNILLELICVEDVLCREHIQPIWKGGTCSFEYPCHTCGAKGRTNENCNNRTSEACEKYPTHFLVNEFVRPLFIGRKGRKIFMKCPQLNCRGMMIKPIEIGDEVICPSCERVVSWI